MQDIIKELKKFNQDRNWDQFHSPKNLVMALSVEVAELMELIQWKTEGESYNIFPDHELADIFIYSLILCYKFDLNPEKIIKDKIKINAKKYPEKLF